MKLAVVALLLSIGVMGGCSKSCKQDETTTQPQTQQSTSTEAPEATTPSSSDSATSAGAPGAVPQNVDLTTDAAGLSKAVVVMKTSRGTLKFKLYAKDAPNTVKRFVDLVQTKFYNGLSFHRVVPGFVVQTGDPKSRNKDDKSVGTGGSGTKLKAEINGRRHVRGTVAMARTVSDLDSADSQFYVALNAFPHLDDKYTVFGMVVDFGEKVNNQDVLERIRQWDEVLEMHIE